MYYLLPIAIEYVNARFIVETRGAHTFVDFNITQDALKTSLAQTDKASSSINTSRLIPAWGAHTLIRVRLAVGSLVPILTNASNSGKIIL